MKQKITKVWIDEKAVYIQTEKSEIYSEQFIDYPRLFHVTSTQLANFEYDNIGIRWEDVDEDLSYDGFMRKKTNETPLYKIFKENSDINISSLARRMHIPQSVMASYICGVKKPSEVRKKQIEQTLHEIGKKLLTVRL
ncbi:MAG: DUF2442 domain-containing protein [Prevotellaceae bacterium]|jgi:uncharacterized pyridoxamine 5'-phosphate oxidase family protein|nr:DUF2442 domain-containing protein [Prevotellaceae bacterium]